MLLRMHAEGAAGVRQHEPRALASDACFVAVAAHVLHLHQQVVSVGSHAAVLLVHANVHALNHYGADLARTSCRSPPPPPHRPRSCPVPPVHERDLHQQLHGSPSTAPPNTALAMPRTRSMCPTSRGRTAPARTGPSWHWTRHGRAADMWAHIRLDIYETRTKFTEGRGIFLSLRIEMTHPNKFEYKP